MRGFDDPSVMLSDEKTERREREAIQGESRSRGKQAEGEEPPNPFTPPSHWKLLDVARVRDWECPPLEWIIEGIVAKGNLVFVAAASQTGKTLLFLYIARMMVCGGSLFGKFKVNPVKKLLYMVLEDPDRRIKERLIDMEREGSTPPGPGRCLAYIAPGFKLNDALHFLWLEELIREERYEVVILDTYQKATPGISSYRDEEQSLILHRLCDLTRKLNLTIIVLDHVRKNNTGRRRSEVTIDDLKGTGGKVQNSDVWILMDRAADGEIKFRASSKDAGKPVAFLLEVAPQGSTQEKFTYVGDMEEFAKKSKEKAEQSKKSILSAIHEIEWISCGEIARKTGLSDPTVRRHLNKLVEQGTVVKQGSGRYTRYQLINQSVEPTS